MPTNDWLVIQYDCANYAIEMGLEVGVIDAVVQENGTVTGQIFCIRERDRRVFETAYACVNPRIRPIMRPADRRVRPLTR